MFRRFGKSRQTHFFMLSNHANSICQTLAPALSLPVIASAVLPILKQLVNDPIPNIRFNVAKSYAVIVDILRKLPDDETTTLCLLEKDGRAATAEGSAKGQQLIQSDVLPQLEKLMQDDDVDVRFFASTAAKGTSSEGAAGDAMET
jgi:serine/threonine-protein phosphatase 2A regulatory subunit A